MDLQELTLYLGAVAAADAPIDDRERDLIRHLLKDFGAEHDVAHNMVSGLPAQIAQAPTLNSLSSRDDALKLLRALLVIAYCDGSFDREEVPYLTSIVDGFNIQAEELSRAKRQAMYFLRLSPPSVSVPQSTIDSQDWSEVERIAQQQYDLLQKTFYGRFYDDLQSADEESCYLAMAAGPPSFDCEHTRNRFLQSHPDYLHMTDEEALKLLRDEAEKRLRIQWNSSYAGRCNSCYLEAPGKRNDPCPRCGAEYGEAPRR